MIRYPFLKEKATIGVTAPSSGVPEELHEIMRQAITRMEQKGYQVITGETVWTDFKAKSSPAKTRAEELDRMFADPEIDIIIPPWGGELLIETLDLIDYGTIPPKWILGYSDTSLLLFAITLKTGIATAHGTNIIDLRGNYSDQTTAMWEEVLKTKTGGSVTQTSSEKYQLKWSHDTPSPCVFHLTEQTEWKSVSGKSEHMEGRLLGGCIDIIHHAAGTPFGNVSAFRETYIPGEPIIWYFENCDLSATDLRRSLVQLKLAGWFENCGGLLFGRSDANHPVDGYTAEDVYSDLADELGIPVLYDIDCGHMPPQMTFINGAFAKVTFADGKGKVVQYFK
ncbi:peptidase S66 [Bacillus sp. FJAT-27225]|uniref:S66 family peptidase n=1 Tax=Bacillus sp. FJAT-27225 TaxID=1743144 RepID=UPI00080C2715|nr:S66 peptidase family protein [Bacillus sp. FJAT-27225]OCA90556.1 peptidase S66 [Bacillus sp. FJAT-27225]